MSRYRNVSVRFPAVSCEHRVSGVGRQLPHEKFVPIRRPAAAHECQLSGHSTVEIGRAPDRRSLVDVSGSARRRRGVEHTAPTRTEHHIVAIAQDDPATCAASGELLALMGPVIRRSPCPRSLHRNDRTIGDSSSALPIAQWQGAGRQSAKSQL